MKILLSLALIALHTTCVLAQNSYTSSLKAHYTCSGSFNDVSGNLQHATVTGSVLTLDKNGIASSAYKFDGIDDFVSIPVTASLSRFTLMARIKFSSSTLMNIFYGSGAARYPSVRSGRLAWYDGTAWRQSLSLINDGQWHDVAFIFNNTTYSLYVDGIIEYTGLGNASTLVGNVSLIGKYLTDIRFFSGDMDDIKIYDADLTATQITDAFNGYPVTWDLVTNLTVNPDNTITKPENAVFVWDAGATSLNTLASGQDGYVEFTYTGAPSQVYMVCLAKLNNEMLHSRNDYCYYVNANNLNIYQKGANVGSYGKLVANDRLKIAREGNAINYYKNNAIVKTITLTSNSDILHADISVYRGGSPAVFTSMEPALHVKPIFQFPTLSNNNGSISLELAGQVAPVQYSWSTGETTAMISNKSRGTYSVVVTDALGRSSAHTYYLGYPIYWKNITNVEINANNSLTKTDEDGFTAGAASTNFLPENSDGWIEFVINNPTSRCAIGFSRVARGANYNHDFSWFVDDGVLNIIEGNVNLGEFGTLSRGDVFRVERQGATIKYYLNGIEKRSVVSDPSHCYVADVSIGNRNGPTPVITASFDKKIQVTPSLIFPNTSNENGGIALNILGVHNPVNVSWSSGETVNMISDKPRGTYAVTITDAVGQNFSRSYRVGYPIIWTDLHNLEYKNDNTLVRLPPVNLWDGSALSANLLPPSTDGWIEFTAPDMESTHALIGLARPNDAANLSSVDYAFYFYLSDVRIFEQGTNLGFTRNIVEGDLYTIAREGPNIVYYVNGTPIRTVASSPAYQLVADVSVRSGTIPPVSASFTRTSQTYFAIGSGVWTNPAIWSLSENGTSATNYPANMDYVNIKNHSVTISSHIYCGPLNIVVKTPTTALKINGTNNGITVKGNIIIRGENNLQTGTGLLVENDAKVVVQSSQ